MTDRKKSRPCHEVAGHEAAPPIRAPLTGSDIGTAPDTNPQDAPDSGTAGASRPRGQTEDPDRTL